ncbi:MAG: amidohydrolase, partial [Pseudomonadota bacterium]
MSKKTPEDRLPIKLDSTSNGEFVPLPLTREEHAINELALEQSDAAARKTGQDRRAFLQTSCGAAATLLAFNEANAFRGATAANYAVPKEAAFDPDAAAEALEGHEFIFDVQGHYLPPNLARTLKPQCKEDFEFLSSDYMRCLGADSFLKDVFLDSDTDMMALSFVP